MLRQLWAGIARRIAGFRRPPTNVHRPQAGALPAGSLGRDGERLAAQYLQRLGYRILARGHRQKLGELDLVALDRSQIVFVEVKTWRRRDVGDPSTAVDLRKQERLTRAALVYLKRRKLLEHPARFDVISIVWPDQHTEPEIRHFINAFEAVGKWQMYR